MGAGEGGEKAKGAGRATKRPRADAAKEGPKDYFDAARASKGTKKALAFVIPWFTSADVYLRGAPLK